jgi:hypothetical protein
MLTTILLALALLIALSLLNGIRSELIWIGAGIRRIASHLDNPPEDRRRVAWKAGVPETEV